MTNNLIDEVTAQEAHHLLNEYMKWCRLAKSPYVFNIVCCGSDKNNTVTVGYEDTGDLCAIVKKEAEKIASAIFERLKKIGVNL